jgi:hypothetical protein
MALSILLALLQALATPAPPAPALADWGALPAVGLTGPNRMTADVTGPVERLARGGRLACRAGVRPMADSSRTTGVRMVGLEVRLIVLVAPDGRLLDILTSPGHCDAIRNHARRVFEHYNRGLVRPPAGPGAAWYRSSLRFSWEP